MSVGPIIVALTAVPFGRIVDKFGTNRMIIFGLIGIIVGCCMLSMIPITFGILGYVMSMLVVALGYSLFQTSNNTAVMKDVIPEQRGVISGMLNLSRNLGLITGASVMGAIFAFASGTSDISTAPIKAVASGMHATFAVGTILIIGSLAIVLKVGPRK